MQFDIRYFDSLDSTNSYLKHHSVEARDGDVIVAKKQTGGRGRLGRQFFSPDGGLYFSIMLKRPLARPFLLTPLSATAVSDALIALGAENIGIKWVNDIYAGGKKACGILAETAFRPSGELDWAIVGIGINISEPETGFPEDIAFRAGAAFKKENAPSPKRLLEQVLSDFDNRLSEIDSREFLNDYRERSVLIGKKIEVVPPSGEPYAAKAAGIDDECRLIVDGPNGRETLYMGEVSIKL